MTAITFNNVGNRIKNSPFIVPIYYTLWMGLLVSGVLLISDFYTGYRGVDMLPVRSPDGFVDSSIRVLRLLALALLPQVASVISGYVSMSMDSDDENELKIQGIAKNIMLFSLSVDGLTGMIYYFPYVVTVTNVLDHPAEAVVALFLAGVIDTVGSEILFLVSFGLLLELKPNFKSVFNRFMGSKATVSKNKGGGNSKSKGKNGSRKNNQRSGGGGNATGRNSHQNNGNRPRNEQSQLTQSEQAWAERNLINPRTGRGDQSRPRNNGGNSPM